MKTIFTFLIIILLFLSKGYSQNTTSQNINPEILSSSLVSESQIFTINKAYPNPVKDFVTIEIQSPVPEEIYVSLINILGVEVKKWEGHFLNQGEQKIRIDLTSIKTGVYFLRISQSDQVRTQVLKKI